MLKSTSNYQVRPVNEQTNAIDLVGDITAFSENALFESYAKASESGVRLIILNFKDVAYMNSSGIGLLITLLIRARRQGVKMAAIAVPSYIKNVLDLTRLNEALPVYEDEAQALAGSVS